METCAQCQIVNGNAWDIAMYQVGARKAQPDPNLEQRCRFHPNITFGERVKLARYLDDTLLYQRHDESEDDPRQPLPMIALSADNGFTRSRVDVARNDRFLEEIDAWPAAQTLADFGYRAQLALEFYETWLTEVSSHLIARSGHRIEAAAQAQAPAQPPIGANNTQDGSGLLSQALQPAQQQPAQQQPAQQPPLTVDNAVAQSAPNTTTKPLEKDGK